MKLAERFVQYTPLASHAVTERLDQFGLPTDCDRLADWLYGTPEQLDGGAPAYGSAELVLGAALVLPVGADLFEIDDAGKWVVLQPVAPGGETIIDLVASHPACPDRWRLMTGHGEALGEREIALRHDRDGPLKVFETPLSWHRAGGRGVCILRRHWAVAQRLFCGERELIVETVELGDRLEQALSFRPSPMILVDQMGLAA